MSQEKKKIAVLGGGTGSMATVWSLTSLPDWSEKYDITVYQVGWRLGGKGASGRNPEHGQRVEEHGLHVWGGFYDNAFQIMRDCYAELNRHDGKIRDFKDAFKQHNNVLITEHIKGKWENWFIEYPSNSDEPGNATDSPSIWAYIEMLLEAIHMIFKASPLSRDLGSQPGEFSSIWETLTGGDHHPEITPETPKLRSFPKTLLDISMGALLEAAHQFAGWLGMDAAQHYRTDQLRVVRLLEQAFKTLDDAYGDVLDDDPNARHLYLIMDTSLAIVRGLIMDGVVLRGWDAIDIWNWPDWMRRWGASEYSLQSVMFHGIFDYIFGYPKGDTSFPRAGAGAAIHGMMRLSFAYKGSLFWEMQAGMGDIVFAPMYEVLKRRGVKFEFFHKISNLGLNADADGIERIEVDVQATLKHSDYDPLVDVKGVPSWPSYPLYDQLVQGEQLKAAGTNLESSWDPWQPVEKKTLVLGEDFDEVVLGISIGAFPYVCPELIDASPRFKRMVYGIKTAQTQAVQLWLDAPREEIGAPTPPVVATGFVDPINTWADMSYIIDVEDWGEDTPKFLGYFCGPMEQVQPIPPFSDHGFPERERQRVVDMARDWFASNTGAMWPGATSRSNPSALNLELLHGEGTGEERFLSQYFRANYEPTERYVLSVPGSTALRMKANGSRYTNLYLAGDWTYTAFPAGCIECAVMSGMHAAEAISGQRLRIACRAY